MSKMSLNNATSGVTLQNYNLIHTNSGFEIAVLAGVNLIPSRSTNATEFNVTKGANDSFILVVTDQNGGIWQNCVGVDLDSRGGHIVIMKVTGTNGSLKMTLTTSGGEPLSETAPLQGVTPN